MSVTLPPFSRLLRFIGASFLAAIAGSVVSTLAVLLALAFLQPGDGGSAGAAVTSFVLIVPVAIFVFVLALPFLIVVGIPATWPFAGIIADHGNIARAVGCLTGALIGWLADRVLGMEGSSVAFAPTICGGVIGFFWIVASSTIGAFELAEQRHG